jgi:predicted ATPase
VWFVPLDAIDSPVALLSWLLSVLRIEPSGHDELASLVQGLRFRDAILIFDNCEHLLDAVASVTAEVVSACPNIRILATSREPLDVEGERVRRVRSLSRRLRDTAFWSRVPGVRHRWACR